jgi:hypothetical protein
MSNKTRSPATFVTFGLVAGVWIAGAMVVAASWLFP